ncbi:MAG: phosphate signaling complex protein PhoU [Pseudomonadota bacterium]
MNHSYTQHISHQFNTEMEEVRQHVLTMGGLVEQQIAQALQALQEENPELGQKVFTDDYKVNALEVSIDEECTVILARRQPAASDLRMVVAILKTITDLERIGDEAEKIARLSIAASKHGLSRQYLGIHHLGKHVEKMLHNALDAFARTDVEVALAVLKEDAQVDQEYQSLMRQLITFMMEDARTISGILEVMWAARSLERVGDHAKNICEYIIYQVKGKDIRHTNLEQMEEHI